MLRADHITSWRKSRTSNEFLQGTARLEERRDTLRTERTERTEAAPSALTQKRHQLDEARREYVRLEAQALAGQSSADRAERAACLLLIQSLRTEIDALTETAPDELALIEQAIKLRQQNWGSACRTEQEREAREIAKAFDEIVPKALKAARELMPALAELERLQGLASSDLASDANCPGYRSLVPQTRCVPQAPASTVLRNWINAMVELGW
jgi:hypothetical protein